MKLDALDKLLISRGNKPRRGRVVSCAYCGERVYLRLSSLRKHNYCSVHCHNKHQLKGNALVCIVCGTQYYRSPSQIRLRGSNYCSNECKWSVLAKSQLGDKNSQWADGVSTENHRLRASKRWRAWRGSVFERDNWSCQTCGARSGHGASIILHPHHIKPFAKYPELRFELSNGVTQCLSCHKAIHYESKD